jgi:hypothetical protein
MLVISDNIYPIIIKVVYVMSHLENLKIAQRGAYLSLVVYIIFIYS